MTIEMIAVAGLAFIAVFGVAYVLLYPTLSGEARVEKRQKAIEGQGPDRTKRAARAAEVSKRDQVLQSLKELEAKQKKAKSPPLSVQIEQAGLDWTKQSFFIFSIVMAVVVGAAAFFATSNAIAAGVAVLVGGLGVPRWYLKRRKTKRIAAFAEEFANALDVIVRGVKAGLPLGDCLRVIASESQEPVKSEFRMVVETQAMGVPMGDAVQRIYERMPCAEANFFGIVIAIQQKAGGNLSEALSNLSKVLRERKKMRAKIKAMSTEAKASAGIIGALPPFVMGAVYLTTPGYMSVLFATSAGNLMLLGCALWMSVGIFIMKKMINFDF
jgi:tight adherence protein B